MKLLFCRSFVWNIGNLILVPLLIFTSASAHAQSCVVSTVANFTGAFQIAAGFAIPGLNLGHQTLPTTCQPLSYRVSPSSVGALPAGVSLIAAASANAVSFTGTPTTVGSSGVITIQSSNDSTTWTDVITAEISVAACLDWTRSTNRSFAALYSPAASEVNRGVIPPPVAGVPYDVTVTMLPNLYPISAYCTASSWQFSYRTAGANGTLAAAPVPGSPLAFRIQGTPTVSGQTSPDGCDNPDGSNDATATGLSVGSLTFCYGAGSVVPPAITISGNPPGGLVGSAYSTTFTSNAPTPNTIGFSAGALPPGLTLSSAGVLSGVPTTPGTYTFTLSVTSSQPTEFSGAFSITIGAAPPEVAANVPTLSQWSLIALALLLAAAGWRSAQRKK